MSKQHKNLTGTDLHEPKGLSSATVDTVYVANGSGAGEWKLAPVSEDNLFGLPTPGSVGDILTSQGVLGFEWAKDANKIYGEAYISGNTTVTTITTGDTYQKVGTSITWNGNHQDGLSFTTDHWVIATSGDYKLSACISYTGGGTSKIYTFAFGVDSGSGIVVTEHGVMRSKTSGSTDIKSIPVQAIDVLTAGDLVYLMVKNESDTTGLTITNVNFTIELKEVI